MKNKNIPRIIYIYLIFHFLLAINAAHYIGITSISIVFMRAIIEELIFRKYIFEFIKEKTSLLFAVIVVGMIFSTVHLNFNLGTILSLFLSSVLYSLVYLSLGKLHYSIIIHAFDNIIYNNIKNYIFLNELISNYQLLGFLKVLEFIFIIYLVLQIIAAAKK